MASLLAVPGLASTSLAFRQKLLEICARLGLNPDYLVSVMSFESGHSFSPSKRNPLSNATGLIQFMPATARSYGTTVDALAALTAEQQLDYVERFFQPHTGKLRSISDHYLAVFMPALIGRDPSYQVACSPSKLYTQNAGFDRAKTGCYTVGDIVSPVSSIYNSAQSQPRLPVGSALSASNWMKYVALGAVVGLTFGVGLKLLRSR